MVGKEKATGTVRVCVDSRYFRPTEVDVLLGTLKKPSQSWVESHPAFQPRDGMVDADIQLFSGNVPLLSSP